MADGAPTVTYPPELPISELVDELGRAISAHQVVVVAGETGSGKSTQLPKICLALGRGDVANSGARIGHTQPRRIAARSIAERVADELGTDVGDVVGYAVRFNDRVGAATRIKLMTDGILLAEIQRDRMLRSYDTLIIDEAHERSLNIDFLLGYLKQLLPRRPDLRVIITSATIDTERFSEHFDDAPVIEVSGRTHPVEIRYRPLSGPEVAEERDQTEGICDAVVELSREGPGDVLVFCSGEREIRDAAEALEELTGERGKLRGTEIFPLYARLPSAEQQKVFKPHVGRRVVVATNVAETSLTVPGILSVVDPGTARISRFNNRTKVQRLPIEPVSQASANQRAGRCGRVAPGVCIRLYAEDDFDARPEFTEPEIQRTNLSSVILQMAALGLGDIEAFPFVQPPESRSIRDGIAVLEELGAVDPDLEPGTKEWLTPLGRRLARLPVDPRLARMVIEAGHTNCLSEVLVIAAGLSLQDPRERPSDKRQVADEHHQRFIDGQSDFLGLLHLWNYVSDEKRARTSNQFRRMCRKEFLNYSRLREWQDLHSQLKRVAKDLGLKANRQPADPDDIHRALLAGLLSQVGQVRPKEKSKKGQRPRGREFTGARAARFAIAPGQALSGQAAPEWVMVGELVETNRLWARMVAPIDPAWIEELADHLVTRSYDEPVWDEERGSSVVTERVSHYGLPLVTGRQVQYVRIDPAGARDLFIEHALVDGEWAANDELINQREAVLDQVRDVEARTRNPEFGIDRRSLFRFFDERIGPDIATAKAFDRWWRRVKEAEPHLLSLTPSDARATEPPDGIETDFPDVWPDESRRLRLLYEFDVDSDADGVTIEVPVADLGAIEQSTFDWQVPGLRAELVESLLRSLPRELRKNFVPVPETVVEILPSLNPALPLRNELANVLTTRSGVLVEPRHIRLDTVPAHLRPTFLLLDEAGEPFLESKDLAALRNAMDEHVRSSLATTTHRVERHGLRTWTAETWPSGEIPTEVTTEGSGHRVKAYPALSPVGEAVDLVMTASVDEQADLHWQGLQRLLRFAMASPVKQLDRLLSNDAKLALAAQQVGRASWYNDAVATALDSVMERSGAPVWTHRGFELLVASCRAEFPEALAAVASEIEKLAPMVGRLELLFGADRSASLEASTVDARAHLSRLVYEGFLSGVGLARLPDISRYVQAIEYRMDRLPEDPSRDRDLMLQCRSIEAEYAGLRVPWSVAYEDIAWMLEEYRVSLLAQPIGAVGPVSDKRIRKAIRDL